MHTTEIASETAEIPTVIAVPEREGWVKPNLVDALREIGSGISLLDFSLGAIGDDLADGDTLGLLYLLSEIRDLRQRLHTIEASVEARCARAMSEDRVEAPDLLAIRRSGNVRKAWDKERMVSRVAQAAAGEEDDVALREALVKAVEFAYAVGTPSWKVTALRAAGIRYDDACETERGRRTVEVKRGAEIDEATDTDA